MLESKNRSTKSLAILTSSGAVVTMGDGDGVGGGMLSSRRVKKKLLYPDDPFFLSTDVKKFNLKK